MSTTKCVGGGLALDLTVRAAALSDGARTNYATHAAVEGLRLPVLPELPRLAKARQGSRLTPYWLL